MGPMGPIGLISLIGLYPTFLKEKGVVTPHTPNFEFCILHFELKNVILCQNVSWMADGKFGTGYFGVRLAHFRVWYSVCSYG